MNLKNRLSKLEKTTRRITAEADCICFPPDEQPCVRLGAEREAVTSVTCPIHGKRFEHFEGGLSSADVPLTHLNPNWRTAHSPQYVKAMDASFPPDRWPATKVRESDGTHRYLLKDGTEIGRVEPKPVYSYGSGELSGFLEGFPPKFTRISVEHATKVTDPDGTEHYVLKDGTEIVRIEPEPEILHYYPPPGRF